MNERSMAIVTLCSQLSVSDGIIPLRPKEYSELAILLNKKQMSPEALSTFDRQDYMQLLDFNEEQANRFLRLFDRSASLSFEIGKYESMGISLLTRADSDYPAKLKRKLGSACPPLFYVAGNRSLLNENAVGYVGSRTVGEKDKVFTQSTVHKTVDQGNLVVSGGAKGIDSIATESALSIGGNAVVYLADSMHRKLRSTFYVQAVQQGKLLLLSVVKPDSGFNVGIAMMRNKYIYAQSEATVVIKSDYDKGGTWAGATENLRNKWALTLCWNNLSYPGNKALIEKGAIPIDKQWDGKIFRCNEKDNKEDNQKEPEQLDMFGNLGVQVT